MTDAAAIEAGYSDEMVRALLREQHPDLAGLPLRRVAGGWDNQLWRLGADLAVRLPRTERGPELLRKEHRWVPGLAPDLPLPVTVPLRLTEPSARFPRPWTVSTWVHGAPADHAEITDAGSAEILARFLRALHRPAPDGAPFTARHTVALSEPTQEFHRHFQDVAGEPFSADFRKIWDAAISTPANNGPAVWLHGDLHPANVVTADGALAGVIDFGELGAGDPAVDLAAAWLLLPPGTAGRFFAAYGTRPDVRRRARGRALAAALGLLEVGRSCDAGAPGGKPSWGRAGRMALERIRTEG